MKPHVLFFINHLSGSGGAQKAAVEICNRLAAAGYAINLVPLQNKPIDPPDLHPRVQLLGLSKSPIRGKSMLARWINKAFESAQFRRQIHKTEKPAVIISFTTGASMKILPLVGLATPPAIVSERNGFPRNGRDADWHEGIVSLYQKAALITSNSKSVLRFFEDRGIRSTFHTPNPYTLPALFKVPEQCRKPVNTILAVGGLREQKGFDLLFKAFADSRLRSETNAKLRIIGEGPLRESLEALAENLVIADRVDWVGVVEDVQPHYLTADLFVLPSRWEGVPNVLLEALGAGVPCLVSDISGNTEYVDNGVHVLVFKTEDVLDLTAKLDALSSADQVRSELSKNGRSLAMKLAEANTIDAWVRAIDMALGRAA